MPGLTPTRGSNLAPTRKPMTWGLRGPPMGAGPGSRHLGESSCWRKGWSNSGWTDGRTAEWTDRQVHTPAGAVGAWWRCRPSPPSTLSPALIYFLLCPQALSTPGLSGAQWCPRSMCKAQPAWVDGIGSAAGGALPGGDFRSSPGVLRYSRRGPYSRNCGPGVEPQAGVGAGWASPGGLSPAPGLWEEAWGGQRPLLLLGKEVCEG